MAPSALKIAHDFIATERAAFIACHTTGRADGSADLATLDADARDMLAREYDPALAAIAAAMAAQDLLQAEVIFWRQEAAASIETNLDMIRSYERDGDLDQVARIMVGELSPMRTALAQALSGRPYHDMCEGCSSPLQEGDVVYGYEDVGDAHVDCDQPQMADPLPVHARRYRDDYTPTRIAAILAAADEYMGVRG